jgi:adenosylcobinamide kinase/adenosylcobinamide-phosphate guanylyltransferase
VPSHVLVLGGQRSGKSRYAEGLVTASGGKPVYLATAEPGDGEMTRRIAAHRARRGEGWRLVEEPLDLAGALAIASQSGTTVLVECLTLWLANLMAAERPIEAETEALIDALRRAEGAVALVSNEVGSGIVPENALARRYADALGVLNQRIAATVDHVVLVAAGLPLILKPRQQTEIAL